jgi:formate-dependent nitrite reductase membrane component NrfD
MTTDEGTPDPEVFARPALEGSGNRTYYDRPVLKETVWLWFIPAYFYAGGAAGAAQFLGGTAQVVDRRGLRGLVKRCRWIATLGIAAGSAFLIADLGRPERFLNMLRVFRPTSAMNMGAWVLAAAGPTGAVSALLADAEGSLGAVGDAAGIAAAPIGLPLAAYTAVLLADTAVPIWQGSRSALPALFVASSVTSAASLLDLTTLTPEEQRIVKRLGIAAKVAELGAAVAVDAEASRVERVARPLKEGVSGSLWKLAKTLTATSLAVSLLPGHGRTKRALTGVMGTGGALAVRFAMHHAGKASTRDPHATFEQQRAGRGAAELTEPVTVGR